MPKMASPPAAITVISEMTCDMTKNEPNRKLIKTPSTSRTTAPNATATPAPAKQKPAFGFARREDAHHENA